MYRVIFLNSVFIWVVFSHPHPLSELYNNGTTILAKSLIPIHLHKRPSKEFTKEEFRTNMRPYLDCDCGVTNSRFKVVGGSESDPYKYPWMVQIVRKGSNSPYCGGSLINNRYVMTAAHCVKGVNPKRLILHLGAHSSAALENTVVKRDIQKITMHPQFDATRFNKDIALLEIDEVEIAGVHKEYIRPVCLPDPMRDYEHEDAIVAGWGRLKNNGVKPGELQETTVKILTLGSCKNDFGFGKKEITNKMMCAAGEGKDACQGDSGGPLVTKTRGDRFEQVGIVSWGIDCASPNFPGVYTKVDKFMDFIASNTQNADWCRI